MIHQSKKPSFQPYCGCHFLAPVWYFCLIWIVSRANHGARGGRDATGAGSIGARLADWQPFLLKSCPFPCTTGTPLGVCRSWNSWTTWEIWNRALSESTFQNESSQPTNHKTSWTVSLISVICLTEVRVSSLALVGGGAALRLVGRGGRRCTRGGRGSGVFASSVGDGTGSDSS